MIELPLDPIGPNYSLGEKQKRIKSNKYLHLQVGTRRGRKKRNLAGMVHQLAEVSKKSVGDSVSKVGRKVQ